MWVSLTGHSSGGSHSKNAAAVDMKVDASARSKSNPPNAPNPPTSIPDNGSLPPKTSVNICGAEPPKLPNAFVKDAMSPPWIAPSDAPTAPINFESIPRGPDNPWKAPTISPLSIDWIAVDSPPIAVLLPEKSTNDVNAAA